MRKMLQRFSRWVMSLAELWGRKKGPPLPYEYTGSRAGSRAAK